jgi:hypothetical protein
VRNARVLVVLETLLNVPVAAKQDRASRYTKMIFGIVVKLPQAAVGVDTEAVEVAVGDEVHHTADGVRAIHSGGATGHHIDRLSSISGTV